MTDGAELPNVFIFNKKPNETLGHIVPEDYKKYGAETEKYTVEYTPITHLHAAQAEAKDWKEARFRILKAWEELFFRLPSIERERDAAQAENKRLRDAMERAIETLEGNHSEHGQSILEEALGDTP